MKRLSLILAISFVLLSFGLANAVDVEVFVDPSYFAPDLDDGGALKIKAGSEFTMELLFGNTTGTMTGYAMNLVVSGDGVLADGAIVTLGSAVTTATPTDLQGIEYVGSFVWTATSSFYNDNWDGTLPDTMAHSVLDFSGWDQVGMVTQYEVKMTLNMALGEAGNICFSNTTNHPNTDHNWLFAQAGDQDFDICFPAFLPPNQPPEIDCSGLPSQMTKEHDETFSLTGIPVADPDIDPPNTVTGVTPSIGTVEYVPGAPTFDWSWSPLCSDVGGSFTLEFTATDGDATSLDQCDVDLVVNNTAPVIAGDCGEALTIGTNAVKTLQFSATDDNSGDTEDWSIAPSPVVHAGSIGTTDVSVDAFGEVTVTSGPDELHATYTVVVEDCDGATDECTFDVTVVGSLPFMIVIEKEEGPDDIGVYQGQHTQVAVSLEQATEEMLGFDFLIAYDNSAMAFTGAYAGILFNMPGAYEWEYFTYRFGATGNCDGGCPSGLLRVVGIADQNDGPHTPVSVMIPAGTVLFTLDFLVSNDRTLECMFLPVSFFWMDCGDNSIAMHELADDDFVVKQAIAAHVYGYNGTPEGYELIPENPFTFPAYTLDADYCITLETNNPDKLPPKAFIEFYNGGVDIACADDIDARGDVNLNGVVYEIADAVVFTNYFIYGFDAFTVSKEGQTAATDANADGIPLSVADLVYLIRVVVGDALPYPKVAPVAEAAKIAVSGTAISVDAELGAVAFAVEGEVLGLGSDAQHMELKTDVRDGITYGVIYSFEEGAAFAGEFLNINGRLASIEGATYDGAPMKFVHLPTSFDVKNYPNPFNPATTFEAALPIATDWNLSIYNVTGQKVKDFSGYNEAGIIKVTFDASNYASGIYFYKFQAGTEEITKKMVLLK